MFRRCWKREQGETTGDRCEKDGINYQLKCEDIRYLEAIPRGTRLHLVTENWDVPYVTLRQMLLKMPKGMFAQCHRMYAVNKMKLNITIPSTGLSGSKLSGYGRNRCDLQIGDRRTVKWLIGYANFYIVFSA